VFDENQKAIKVGDIVDSDFLCEYDENDRELNAVKFRLPDIERVDEIGEYLGEPIPIESELTDEEIEIIMKCRINEHADENSRSIECIYKDLYDAGFSVMDINKEYDDLRPLEKRKRDNILTAHSVVGDIKFNNSSLACPICGGRYVAQSFYSKKYPVISAKRGRNGEIPLTIYDKDFKSSFCCLNCGSRYGDLLDLNPIFRFERGAYTGGALAYSVYEMDECLILEGFSYNGFSYMQDYRFKMLKTDIDELMSVLKKAKRWKEEYDCDDDVYDGYEWELFVDYKSLKISSAGYVGYPRNYKKVVKKIQTEIEKLCETYAYNYSSEGVEERLSL